MTHAPSHTPQELEQILEGSDLLFLTGDGTYKVMELDAVVATINTEVLFCWHPHLPKAVETCFARAALDYANTGDDSIDCRTVSRTAQLLCMGSLLLQSMSGRTRSC